jgi:hypothetical protein
MPAPCKNGFRLDVTQLAISLQIVGKHGTAKIITTRK